MLLKKNENKKILAGLVVLGVIILASGYYLTRKPVSHNAMTQESDNQGSLTAHGGTDAPQPSSKIEGTQVVRGNIVVKPDIDYKKLKTDKSLNQLMKERKKKLGLKNSLDLVVRSDESFKIGRVKVSMRDILEKAFIKKGRVFQEQIEESGAVKPGKIRSYGIYVVRPGDNIWNIHFNILKEYYESRGINVSPKADEPIGRGMSSGVGKILKFSETMVIIYNLKEKKVDTDINLIEPLSKIVVYNMEEVFSLLREINYDNINRIQFDGKTIWFPAKKS